MKGGRVTLNLNKVLTFAELVLFTIFIFHQVYGIPKLSQNCGWIMKGRL